MKYLKLFFVATVFSVLFMGFGSSEKIFTKGIKKGNLAPTVCVQDTNIITNGKYVFIQFWAAYDGESRKQNALLSNEIEEANVNGLQAVSICLDEKSSVFEQAVKADHLNPDAQFYADANDRKEIVKNYKLEQGFGNLLIDPNGVIVAKNITSFENISKIMKREVAL